MSEMVERVAKAQAGERWESFDEEHKDAARDLARVAIEAMREPTAEMINAAYSLSVNSEVPEYVYIAMIDAALKDAP